MAWIVVIFAWSICFAASIAVKFKSSSFTQLTVGSASAIRLDESWIEQSVLSCILNCKVTYSSCASIVYDRSTGLCSPGSIAINLGTHEMNPSQGDFFSQGICDASLGFNLYQQRKTVECLYISGSSANYSEARNQCASLNAIMYTAKTQDKFDLFRNLAKNVIKWFVFVGLNDLLKEGTFVWEDGESLDPVWSSQIFLSGQPDNWQGQQDCVYLDPLNFQKIDDGECSVPAFFICQMIQT